MPGDDRLTASEDSSVRRPRPHLSLMALAAITFIVAIVSLCYRVYSQSVTGGWILTTLFMAVAARAAAERTTWHRSAKMLLAGLATVPAIVVPDGGDNLIPPLVGWVIVGILGAVYAAAAEFTVFAAGMVAKYGRSYKGAMLLFGFAGVAGAFLLWLETLL